MLPPPPLIYFSPSQLAFWPWYNTAVLQSVRAKPFWESQPTMLLFVPMQCKCFDALQQTKCVMDGLRYDDGARWTKNNCTVCKCEVSVSITERISGRVLIDSKLAPNFNLATTCWQVFSRAWQLLHVFAWKSDWLISSFVCTVIGQSCCFDYNNNNLSL